MINIARVHFLDNYYSVLAHIRFDIPAETRVRLEIYDILGRRVATLIDRKLSPGVHTSSWLGCDDRGKKLGSGVYFYNLQAGVYKANGKIMFLR